MSPKKPYFNCGASSKFVSSSIPSWQILIAHAQPFRGARDLAFCLKVPLDSLLVWASSRGSSETAWMRRLALTFAARIGDKYEIRLTWPNCGLPQVTPTWWWMKIKKKMRKCLLPAGDFLVCCKPAGTNSKVPSQPADSRPKSLLPACCNKISNNLL